MVVLRYIEADLLRAGLVMDLADYPWLSYGVQGLPLLTGRMDELTALAGVAGQVRRRFGVHRTGERHETISTPEDIAGNPTRTVGDAIPQYARRIGARQGGGGI